MKVKIKDVTLIIIDCKNYGLATMALLSCMNRCEFDRVLFLTDADLEVEGVEVVNIPSIRSKEEYSAFIIKELHQYFDTPHCLIIQHDGIILNADCWDDGFKQFDYIGACWMYPKGEYNVGNGGFSLRSKRIMDIVANDDFIKILHPEDEILGRLYRRYLEQTYDIRFAPDEVANKFSFELNAPTQKTFGHHAYFHRPYKEHIVLRRSGALGDVAMLEPVMEYYHNKGYQVVLDTMPDYMRLFFQHYYPVLHLSQMDENIKPVRVINFDMAYEVSPKQPTLKSYYDVAGIKDGVMRNSRLNINRGGAEKFFDKYVVIHCDSTNLPHRNINKLDWTTVVRYLESEGYLVFQIGIGKHENVATFFNAMTIELMMYFIKHADLFIGIDSGPLQIAVGLDVPSVGFFGSVNPLFRYTNFDKLRVVQNPCDYAGCYHETIGTMGSACIYNQHFPPCCDFTATQVIEQIKQLLPHDSTNT